MLKLRIVDVYGKPLTQPAMVNIRHTARSIGMRTVANDGYLELPGLSNGPSQVYEIRVSAKSYLPVSQLVNVPAKDLDVVMTLPVDIGKVRSLTFEAMPEEFSRLAPPNLDDFRKAGFLNILTKAQSVGNIIEHLQTVTEARGDRIFVTASPDLYETLPLAGDFHKVSGSLHRSPDGYAPAGSWKTHDKFGNLQLTFHRGPDGYIVDMDIDDAQGFRHAFQVIRNAVHGETHPYNIHELLVGYQHLNPGYTFNL